MSIDILDPKCNIEFFTEQLSTTNVETVCHDFDQYKIWELKNFLTIEECNNIICNAENKGFEFLPL